MKILKKVSLLIAAIVMTTLLLQGCGSKTPTDIVNEYLSKVQRGDSNVEELFAIGNDEVDDKKDSDSLSQETQNNLQDKFKEITYKINSESIDGDSAKVNVTVNGMDLNIVFTKVIQEAFSFAIGQAFTGTQMTDEENNAYFESLLNKHLEEVTYSERTGDISLIKENDEWKIQEDESILKLLIGIDNSSFNNFNLDK